MSIVTQATHPYTSSNPGTPSRMQQDIQNTLGLSPSNPSDSGPNTNSSSSTATIPVMLRRVLPQGRKLRVGIIGAGVAGLRAADVLLQHGVDVTIFEARKRVGGRLCQGMVGERVVDLGPNWIHGNNEINPIVQLARKTFTLVCSIGEEEALIAADGKSVPAQDVAETAEAFWGIISDAFKYSNENSATIPKEKSLLDFVREAADSKYGPDGGEDSAVKERKKELLLQEAEMWGAFVGSPVSRQSLKCFWMEECIEGENPFVAGTYSKILEEIARNAVDGGVVRFGRRVVKVKAEEGVGSVRVEVVEEGKQGDEGEKREEEEFDEVIVTCPLGFLKRNKGMFEPPMPERLEQAVDSIGYGNLDKVYITFPTAFWESNTTDTPAVTVKPKAKTDTDMPNTTATTAPLHQPSSSSSSSTSTSSSSNLTETNSENASHAYPSFTHWLTPSGANHDTIQALAMSNLPDSVAHPTLLFYIFPPTSQRISHLLSTTPPSHHTSALTNYLQPYYSLLPSYSPTSENCKPLAALATNWTADELAGYGSYSNFQVGLERGGEDVEVLREGMRERAVWFAGEHSAPFVALGTVTGAYWAGEGVAKKIIEGYGMRELETSHSCDEAA